MWVKSRLRQKVREDVQVVIGNPMLVQTGLDLLDFPTIIFYQTGYSVFTLRQASRRSWRILNWKTSDCNLSKAR